MNFENFTQSNQKQEFFKLIYFPEVIKNTEQLTKDFGFLQDTENTLPFEQQSLELLMEFSKTVQPITVEDFNIDKLTNLNLEDDDVFDEYSDFASGQTQILGYPNFTQSDPLEGEKDLAEYILLFQIESDMDNIMWGDSGVGTLSIPKI